MIKNAKFTSVWDGGYEVTTDCKVNMETKEVFDIEKTEVSENYNICEAEFITIDGIHYFVSTDKEETKYWYQ